MSVAEVPVARAAKSDASPYISAADAIRRHPGLTRAKLYRLVVGGAVRVKLPSGLPPRYSAHDIDRVVSEG